MLLIVRTRDQIKTSIDALASETRPAMGFAVSKLSYHKLDIAKEDEGIIITSPSAALAIPPTRLPLYCIGERTAAEAKSLGHRVLFDGATGSAIGMAQAILRRYPQQKLVHAAGDTADEAWYDLLKSQGFSIRKKEVYSTEYATKFDDDTLKALKAGTISVVSFFSEKGAARFSQLCDENAINRQNLTAVAFSQKVAKQCVGYKQVITTPEPTLNAVKDVLSQI